MGEQILPNMGQIFLYFSLPLRGREMKRKRWVLEDLEVLDRPCGAVLEGLDVLVD